MCGVGVMSSAVEPAALFPDVGEIFSVLVIWMVLS